MAFCTAAASAIRKAAVEFEALHPALAQPLSKFLGQIQITLLSTDAAVMILQLKLALSARPASSLDFGEKSAQHPIYVTVCALCKFFFHYAPRTILRDLLRLLTFLLTPVGGTTVVPNSVCALARDEFVSGWSKMVKLMESAASLSMPSEFDPTNAAQAEDINSTVEICDVLWVVLQSTVPSILPLFDDKQTVATCWNFFGRLTLLAGRDQSQIEQSSQIFSETTLDSLLGGLHGLSKAHPLRERLFNDYASLTKSVGIDLDSCVEKSWFTEENFAKIKEAAIPKHLDDSFSSSSIHLMGALVNGSLSILSGRHCTKDTTYSAGMLLAILSLDLLHAVGRTHTAWIQSQLILSFLPSISSSPSLAQFSILNTLPSGPQPNGPGSETFARHTLSPSYIDSLPLPALICTMRGIIISSHANVGLFISPCASIKETSPETRTVVSPTTSGTENTTSSTLIFDAMLPWFLKNAEASRDRHSRLLAVRSAGASVEFLIKTLSTDSIVNGDEHSKPTSQFLKSKIETCTERLFELIWKNWEDPFDSIVSEIWVIFPLLLDLGERAFHIFGASASLGADFTHKLAAHLLAVDPATKGKYPLLTILLQRVGPARLLKIRPTFVEELFKASSFSIAGRAVGPCIHALLGAIHTVVKPGAKTREKKAAKKSLGALAAAQSENPEDAWTVDPISLLTLPLIVALLDESTQVPIGLYALPHAFELFPATFTSVLRYLTSDLSGGSIVHYDLLRLKAVLLALKVGRSVGLIENTALLHPGFLAGESRGLLPRLIGEALISQDGSCRIDALQFLTETRKQSELPVSLELEAFMRNADYNLLETSQMLRQRSLGLWDSLALRLKDSIRHHYKLPARSLPAQQTAAKEVRDAVAYLNEISSTYLHSLYAAAPPHRRFAALEALRTVATKFGATPSKGGSFVPYVTLALTENVESITTPIDSSPDSENWKKLQIFSPAAALSLIVGLWDQYDSARVLSYDVLKQFPAPIPGFETPNSLRPLLHWILTSICSPRMREADSGSLALRLIANSYIVRSGWTLHMKMKNDNGRTVIDVDAAPSAVQSSFIERMANFCHELLDIVLVHIAETRKSRSYAAMNFPVHGPLMAVRYLVNDINVASLDEQATGHWRNLVVRVMQVSKQVSALALELRYPLRYTHNELGEVDSSADHAQQGGEGMDEDDLIIPTTPVESNTGANTNKNTNGNKKSATASHVGSTEAVTVAAWLSIKEVSFLLGCLVKACVSGATADFNASLKSTNSSAAAAAAASMSSPLPLKLITIAEIRDLGQHLLDNLLVLRHRGAMETTSEGFQVICESILGTNDRALHALVNDWLTQLISRIDNTPWELLSTRRSAGLPYAFLAILRSETNTRQSRTLLPVVFSHLLATASRQTWSSQDSIAEKLAQVGINAGDEAVEMMKVEEEVSDSVTSPGAHPADEDADVGIGTNQNHSPKEHRHQVHAFNVIRAIIRDRSVIQDAAPFVEPVLTLVLQLYHSPHWAVQNAATMAFSTLLERAAGGSHMANSLSASTSPSAEDSKEAGRPLRAPKLTAADFFVRYPVAHAYLTASLASATKAVNNASGKSQTSSSSSSTPSSSLLERAFRGIVREQLLPPLSQMHNSIAQLTEAHREIGKWSQGDGTTSAASASLYAVLLLLSRMSPSKSPSAHAQAQIEPMILLTCSAALSSENSKVRILASKALAPLIATPMMPTYVQSLIDAIPNSPEEYAAAYGVKEKDNTTFCSGAANQLQGLLTLVLQLLRTHTHILQTGADSHSQQQEKGETENSENSATSSSEASFALTSATLLAKLRDTVLPSLMPKLWILRAKAAPIACVLLSILSEFVIAPLCSNESLASSHPKFTLLATTSVLISSLHLRRRASELATTNSKQSEIESPAQAVMEDVMIHRQYKLFTEIVAKALLHLSGKLDLSGALLVKNTGSQTSSSVQSSIEVLMAYPYYEVRLQIYKILSTSIDNQYLSAQRLTQRLLQHLGFLTSPDNVSIDTHPKCVLRIIRLLNALGERGNLAGLLEKAKGEDTKKIFSILQRWASYDLSTPTSGVPISRYCKTSTLLETVDESGVSTSLRQESLAFLAFFLRSIQSTHASSEFEEMMSWWLQSVEKHSRYDVSLTDRSAAVLSLSRYPLHFDALPSGESFPNLVVDYWMLVVRCLQADEAETREIARTIAAKLWASENASQSDKSITIDVDAGLMACTLVCFEYLTRCVSNLPHYWQWLFTGLSPLPQISTKYKSGASASDNGNREGSDKDAGSETNSEKISDQNCDDSAIDNYWKEKIVFSNDLFEQEKANFFHEPALIAQICRQNLLKIAGLASEQMASNSASSSSSPSSSSQTTSMESMLHQHVQEYRTQNDRHLISLVRALSAGIPQFVGAYTAQSTNEWKCMYDQIFTPLYSLLIGTETLHSIYPPSSEAAIPIQLCLAEIGAGRIGVLPPVLAGLLTRTANNPSQRPPIPFFTFASASEVPLEEVSHLSEPKEVQRPSSVPNSPTQESNMSEATRTLTPADFSRSADNASPPISSTKHSATGLPTTASTPGESWAHVFNVKTTTTNFLIPRPPVTLK